MIAPPIKANEFNAKWLEPEEVARTFIPVRQFRQLTSATNSLLLGPRGCGKTTLLKMMTRRALVEWERSNRGSIFEDAFSPPTFEAIYIPSDVRWSFELASTLHVKEAKKYAITSQRLMVCTNTLSSILRAADYFVIDKPDLEAAISKALIRNWRLNDTIPNFKDIRSTLRSLAGIVRGLIEKDDEADLIAFFRQIHPTFFAHALDASLHAIETVSDALMGVAAPNTWALCFDELEIAPDWLRTELLEALRSTNQQNVLLKLTWTPLLPSGLRSNPEASADFKPIRLWHSHLTEPRRFCEDLTREFLRQRLNVDIQPIGFFNSSLLANEEQDESPTSYQRGSPEYALFKDLALVDRSFYRLMLNKGINPADPVPERAQDKDQFFRKVKPIALLRHEFLKSDTVGRGRKKTSIYSGREAVYAMTEGNPRWLLALLSDFVEMARSSSDTPLRLSFSTQARVLEGFAHRFLAQIKAMPFSPFSSDGDITLLDFINTVGRFFEKVVLGGDFPMDPAGSFFVPSSTAPDILAVIQQLLEMGALVYVGSSPEDVPVQIEGSRFRLSYMLAPIFRLPLRLYRGAPLNDVLIGRYDAAQGLLPLE